MKESKKATKVAKKVTLPQKSVINRLRDHLKNLKGSNLKGTLVCELLNCAQLGIYRAEDPMTEVWVRAQEAPGETVRFPREPLTDGDWVGIIKECPLLSILFDNCDDNFEEHREARRILKCLAGVSAYRINHRNWGDLEIWLVSEKTRNKHVRYFFELIYDEELIVHLKPDSTIVLPDDRLLKRSHSPAPINRTQPDGWSDPLPEPGKSKGKSKKSSKKSNIMTKEDCITVSSENAEEFPFDALPATEVFEDGSGGYVNADGYAVDAHGNSLLYEEGAVEGEDFDEDDEFDLD